MKIVLTGSLGRIGKPLTQNLVNNGHSVIVISSKPERQEEIEMLGAKAAIGRMQDVDFLINTFKGADAVYLMIAWDAIGNIFDKNINFPTEFINIAEKYKQSVKQSGVKKVVLLSSIGAHTNQGIGSLSVYKGIEDTMNQLPADVSIKFMRPVAFYPNLFRFMQSIRTEEAIIQSYGGNTKEPWVSPLDISNVIVEELEKPFEGRSFRYIASDEVSPNEVATILGEAIGNRKLKWQTVSAEQLLNGMQVSGMNEWVAKGFIEMQAAQGTGILYEDFYKNKPELGKVKMTEFTKEFASVYNQ
ncbi:NAD(P)H-binding protein [Zunongwangia profunda]|uniref:NAD(P)H-binding protein n=1 Tax=Zunongwangia profunda TaxID=398743 RepID=UPI001D182AE2|nr:NAD(P)H-binding protein [Zunongwangia profunda]MCC4227893.1 NAD(P)H-binding protein [Zunongwangia profunda]